MRNLQALLGDQPVVVVLRASTAERFPAAVDVLVDAGFRTVEVTLTTAGALSSIAGLRARHGAQLTIGAGSIRTPGDAQAAIEAGARFVVGQVTNREVAQVARTARVSYVPGALTPNEILSAWSLGVDAVKVSPVGPLGGASYIRELHGPLPDVPLFPTGGVEPDHVLEYLSAGAEIVGLSARLIQDALGPSGDLSALGQRSERVVQLLEQHRNG